MIRRLLNMCKRTHKFSEREKASFGKGHEVGCSDGKRIGGIEAIRDLLKANVVIYPADDGYGMCKKIAVPKDATDNQILAALEAAQTEVR